MTVNELVARIRARWVGQPAATVEHGEPFPRVRVAGMVPLVSDQFPLPPPVPRMAGGNPVEMLPEPAPGAVIPNAFTPPGGEAYWYMPAGGIYARGQVGRHTQWGLRHRGSLRQYGSQDQQSGPEGTAVIYPPRLPRAIAGPRAVSSNPLGRVDNRVAPTPWLSVVQATQPQGGWP